MVKFYKNGNEFFLDNKKTILAEEFKNQLLYKTAIKTADLDLSNDNYNLKITKDDKTLLVSNVINRPMVIVGDVELVKRLVEVIKKHKLNYQGISANYEIVAEFKKHSEDLLVFHSSLGLMLYYEKPNYQDPNIKEITQDKDQLIPLLRSFFLELNDDIRNRDFEELAETKTSYGYYIDKEIVSFITIGNVYHSYAEIGYAYTKPECRNMGYMQKLLSHVIAILQKQGKDVVLLVDNDNKISNHTYSKLGFKTIYSIESYQKIDLKVNYDDSLISINQSLIKYYKGKNIRPSNKVLDAYLNKGYDKVILMLLDGMGISAIEGTLEKDNFLYKNIKDVISSVFPPTTVSATTSLLQGKTPLEHGWLGWHLYLKEDQPSIVLFMSEDYYKEQKHENYKTEDYLSNASNLTNLGVKEYVIYPSFRENGYHGFKEGLDKLIEIINKDEKSFTYFYCDEPDGTMHMYGPSSKETKTKLIQMNQELEDFIKNLNDDTLLIIVADHGQVDVEPIDLRECPDFFKTLKKMPSGESRAQIFHVSDKVAFEKLFKKYFSKYFILLSKEEIMKLYGKGIPHKTLKTSLGDYVAVATNKYNFVAKDGEPMKGHHGGFTYKEMRIPLIIGVKNGI